MKIMKDDIKYNNIFEALESCSERLSSQQSKDFIDKGIKLGLDTEYKITIKKCNNKDGFSVSMSTHHRGKILTMANISGLPI